MDRLKRGPALSQLVQDQLKNFIIQSCLQPGDALPPEGQLAEKLGVSRGSVREAVKALESLGIIEVRHGHGLFVRAFNFDSVLNLLSFGLLFDETKIFEILQIRKWLETAAIGQVVNQVSDDCLQELEAILARWEAQASAKASTAAEDRAFHATLFSPLENHSLNALLDVFWLVFHNVRVRAITTDLRPTTTLQDHRDILEAVRRRDAPLARRCIEEHFSNLEGRIQEVRTGAGATESTQDDGS
jgi:DNA-binding FadR family transcriptional regulator